MLGFTKTAKGPQYTDEESGVGGSGHIVTTILLEIFYAGFLYLKDAAAAMNYLYALIPLLILTGAIGIYIYNREGDMKLFGACAKLCATGIALQLLIDETYSVAGSFSLIKYLICLLCAFVFLLFYKLFRMLLNRNFTVYLMFAITGLIYIILITAGYDPNGYGTTAWIRIGSFTLQLTDFTKVTAILFYSSLFSSKKDRSAAEILILSSLFFALNLGGSVIIHELGSFFILFFLHIALLTIFMPHGRAKRIYLITIASLTFLCLVMVFVLYKIMLPMAEDGTLNGLAAFIWPMIKKIYLRFSLTANVNQDPLGAGYQLLQAKKALWMAGVAGNTVNFTALPVPESDMAFIALVNGFGLLIGFYVVVLFMRIMVRGSEISRSLFRHDRQDSLIVYGASLLIFLQAMTVILGSCNVIPLVGLPIPFLSRGGTYQAIIFCFCGLLLYMSMKTSTVEQAEGGDDDESDQE